MTEALAKTGGIISGCGFIMAGTFSALAFGGSHARMYQLGFALTFGVLLDTFIVRPILAPASLILVNSGRFGRLGIYLGTKRESKAMVGTWSDQRRPNPSGSCAPGNDWHDPRGRIVVVTGCQVEPAFFFIWSTGVGLGHFIPPAPHPAFHH